jgi:hypothetical protein
MTPPHGTKLSDSGEREVHSTDERLAHFFRCWDREGGPGYKVREEVSGLHAGFIDLTATIRTWGRAIAGAVALLTLAIAFLGYLQMREKDKVPSIVPHAMAETKGPTP